MRTNLGKKAKFMGKIFIFHNSIETRLRVFVKSIGKSVFFQNLEGQVGM